MDPRDIVRFVATDYFGALLVLAYVSLLPVLVISAVGAQTGAYFYIVWTIATSLNLIPLSLSISQTVESVAVGGDPFVQARAVLAHLVKVVGPVVVLVVIAAPWLLAIFGPGYAEAGTDLLRLMALGVLPYGVNVVYFGLARVRRQLRGVVLAQAFLAVATTAIALALLPHIGLTGVGIAWLVSQSIVCGVVLATALRPIFGGQGSPSRSSKPRMYGVVVPGACRVSPQGSVPMKPGLTHRSRFGTIGATPLSSASRTCMLSSRA